MIVAVSVVGVVEMTRDQIVDVIAVGNGFMATACAVLVACAVAGAAVRGRACARIRSADLEHTLIHVPLVCVVKVSVVQVVDVIAVLDGRVAAGRCVDVIMFRVCTVRHCSTFRDVPRHFIE